MKSLRTLGSFLRFSSSEANQNCNGLAHINIAPKGRSFCQSAPGCINGLVLCANDQRDTYSYLIV